MKAMMTLQRKKWRDAPKAVAQEPRQAKEMKIETETKINSRKRNETCRVEKRIERNENKKEQAKRGRKRVSPSKLRK
jgi:small-conductance mechanosensitive channel